MPTMTQQQVYDIIDRWNTPVGQCYEKWKELYNFSRRLRPTLRLSGQRRHRSQQSMTGRPSN